MCFCSGINVAAVVTAATFQRGSPGAWRPPTLSSYPLASHYLQPLPLPPFHFQLFLPRPHIHLFFCLWLCPFHTPSFFPLTCCVGLPCLPLCSLHPLCTVSVSMVTPRGQEWLRGLWHTDTDPNSLHTYFVSRKASRATLRAQMWAYTVRECATTDGRIPELSAAWNGGRAAALLFSLRCCSFQLPDEEGDGQMTLQGKLCFPFPTTRPSPRRSRFSHILRKSHSHISTLMSLLGCVTSASFRSKRI